MSVPMCPMAIICVNCQQFYLYHKSSNSTNSTHDCAEDVCILESRIFALQSCLRDRSSTGYDFKIPVVYYIIVYRCALKYF